MTDDKMDVGGGAAADRPATGAAPLVIGINGYVAAIDMATGAELWRTKLEQGVFSATNHSDVSIIIHGDFVFAGSNGLLFCLAINDGHVIWQNELKGLGYNDVSLAIETVSVQYLKRVVHESSTTQVRTT